MADEKEINPLLRGLIIFLEIITTFGPILAYVALVVVAVWGMGGILTGTLPHR